MLQHAMAERQDQLRPPMIRSDSHLGCVQSQYRHLSWYWGIPTYDLIHDMLRNIIASRIREGFSIIQAASGLIFVRVSCTVFSL